MYRLSAVAGAIPTVPIRIPSRPDANPRRIAPLLSPDTIATPNSPSIAISAHENDNTNGCMIGIAAASVSAPTTPPNIDTAYTAPSVCAALPCRAS